MVKIKVFVDGRAVGWLRRISNGMNFESVLSPSSVKAEKYDPGSATERGHMGTAMLELVGPERASGKAREPVVTFQLVNV